MKTNDIKSNSLKLSEIQSGSAETLLEAFKKSQTCIFSNSIAGLCDAEKRRIHACSNGDSTPYELSKLVESPTAKRTFEFDRENSLEVFYDGSLYVKSTGISECWANSADYFADVVNLIENPEPGLREFFGQEA